MFPWPEEIAFSRAAAATSIFQVDPQHWKFALDDEVATLTMDVDENNGMFDGYSPVVVSS